MDGRSLQLRPRGGISHVYHQAGSSFFAGQPADTKMMHAPPAFNLGASTVQRHSVGLMVHPCLHLQWLEGA